LYGIEAPYTTGLRVKACMPSDNTVL